MILAIDDEEHYIKSYIEELQLSGLSVMVRSSVDSAAEFLDRNKTDVELCIMDIMIPAGKLFRDQDTRFGRRTGFLFYDYIRQRNPFLPVVILTNVTAPDVDAKFGNERLCWWFRKDQCLPFEFVLHIQTILASSSRTDQ